MKIQIDPSVPGVVVALLEGRTNDAQSLIEGADSPAGAVLFEAWQHTVLGMSSLLVRTTESDPELVQSMVLDYFRELALGIAATDS